MSNIYIERESLFLFVNYFTSARQDKFLLNPHPGTAEYGGGAWGHVPPQYF